jgi:hypothetical protein
LMSEGFLFLWCSHQTTDIQQATLKREAPRILSLLKHKKCSHFF